MVSFQVTQLCTNLRRTRIRDRTPGCFVGRSRHAEDAVVIHESTEGGFWSEVPAPPGCYSQGETVDELERNIREAIAGVLELMREQGQKPDSNSQLMDVAV